MKAVLMTDTGDVDVLTYQDVKDPQIKSDTQVKIAIKAAGVNPVDTKIRQRGVFFPDALPAIIGCDGAGEILAVGSGVTQFTAGDEVWFCHGGLGKEPGNYAQQTVIEAAEVALKPHNLSFTQAAAAPLVLITAWEALYDRAMLRDNESVLIHAGAGGVGHVAIQLAKLAGATVYTTVGDDEKAALVKTLGADEVINYKQENFVDSIMQLTDHRGVDIVFDTVGGDVFTQSLEAIAHYGSLVTLLDPGNVSLKTARNKNISLHFELMLTPMLNDLPAARNHQMLILERCKHYIETGKLHLNIARSFPLAEAASAHQLIEQGHTSGKIVLIP